MSFLRFMTIACLAVAFLITFASNLTPIIPLVFLGKSTVPIPLGTLVLGAFSAGLTTSILLRTLMFWQQPRKQRKATATDFSYEPATAANDNWDNSRDQPEINDHDEPPPRRRPERSIAPEPVNSEQFKYVPPSDSVYDANYRVISQPHNNTTVPPVVGSKLPSDSEDWGFDFEDEDAPKA
jgi:hypothetical protein